MGAPPTRPGAAAERDPAYRRDFGLRSKSAGRLATRSGTRSREAKPAPWRSCPHRVRWALRCHERRRRVLRCRGDREYRQRSGDVVRRRGQAARGCDERTHPRAPAHGRRHDPLCRSSAGGVWRRVIPEGKSQPGINRRAAASLRDGQERLLARSPRDARRMCMVHMLMEQNAAILPPAPGSHSPALVFRRRMLGPGRSGRAGS